MPSAESHLRTTAQNNTIRPGFYGWKLVAAFFFINLFNGAFPIYGGTVINIHMAESLGLNRTILGSAMTVFMFSYGVVSLFAGFIIQRIGVKATLFIGSLVLICSSLLMAFFVENAMQFIMVFGILNGIGAGLGSLIPVQTGLNFWFHRRRVLAMSIVFCAAGVGAIVITPLVQQIISLSDGNWRLAWQFIACGLGLSWLITAVFVINKPQDIGQEVDGGDSGDVNSLKDSVDARVYKTTETWTVKDALSTHVFWIIVFIGIAFLLLFNMVIAHGVVHLRDQGISDELAALSIGLLIMFSIIGRLFAGIVGDYVELRFLCFGALVIGAIGLVSLTFVSSNLHVYLYTLVTGFSIGVCFVCGAALISNYYGQEVFAPLYGIASACMVLLGSMSPLVAGLVYDKAGSYDTVIYGIAILVLIAALFTPFATPPERNFK